MPKDPGLISDPIVRNPDMTSFNVCYVEMAE